MFSRLFGNKSKTEEIEEMILLLKGTGVLGKNVYRDENGVDQQKIAFGRDWYSPRYLYRGRGKGEKKPDIYHVPDTNDPTGYIPQIGPFHMKTPRGPGIGLIGPYNRPIAPISISIIPIHKTNYAWARMERRRLYYGHDNGFNAFIHRLIELGFDVDRNYASMREWAKKYGVKTLSTLASIDVEQFKKLKGMDNETHANQFLAWKNKYLKEKRHEIYKDDLQIDKTKLGLHELLKRERKRLEKNKNDVIIKDNIKEYENDIKLADSYGRLYWYFVIRINKNRDGSIDLRKVSLPSKLSRKHDFDKNWYMDPLWDEDELHSILDNMLKSYLEEHMLKSAKNNRMFDHEFGVKNSIEYIEKVNRHDNANKLRTIAISRAGPRSPGEEVYRLRDDEYSADAGVLIPKQYFEIDNNGFKYAKAPPLENVPNSTVIKKLEDLSKKPRTSLKGGIKGEITKFIEYETTYVNPQWPDTSEKAYEESLNSVKVTAIIFSYHLSKLLSDIEKDVFNEQDKLFAGFNCEDETYIELKKWYQYCIDNLVPDLIDEVLDIKPQKSHNENLSHTNYPDLDFLKSESKYFEPSGPRRVAANRMARNRARTPQRNNVINQVVAAVDPQPQADGNLVGIDVEINQFLNLGQPMPLRRLIQILSNPIALFTEQLGGQPSPAALWDLRNWPHSNNAAQWVLIKELCSRWDNGDNQLTNNVGLIQNPPDNGEPILDPRTEQFRNIVGYAWPNNDAPLPPRPVGDGLRNRNKTIPDVESTKNIQRSIKLLGLQMLPAVIAQLHKTFIWTVSNPIKTYEKGNKRLTTIMPGTKWFKNLIFSLCTVENNIPLTGQICQEWLIPVDFQNIKTDFFSDETMFEKIGLTRYGLIKDGEMVGNMIQQKMNATALKWAVSTPQSTQASLYDFELGFNKTSKYDKIIKQFLGKNHLNDLQNFIGNKLSYQSKFGDMASDDQSVNALQEIIALRWQKAELMIYKSELQLYKDMNWFCALWFGVSVVNLLLDKKDKWNALSIIRLGIPTLASISNIVYSHWGTPHGSNLPHIALNINRALYLSALVGVGEVYKELLDDSVEEENTYNVQRYEKRQDWYNWAWSKVTDVRNRLIRPYRPDSEEFIQRSQRFVRLNMMRGNTSILEANEPRRREARGDVRMIWFDTTFPEREYSKKVLFSDTRARNIHYPPGVFFRYKDKAYIVVDDLGSMYNPKESPNDATEFIKNNIVGDYEQHQRWDNFDKIMENIQIGLSSLISSKQYRIAYCLDDNEPVLLSVAAKNTAQSFKGTIQILSASVLMMLYSENNIISDQNIWSDPKIKCLSLWSIAENNRQTIPVAASIATASILAGEIQTENSMKNLVATSAATLAYNITSNWIVNHPIPCSSKEKEIYLNGGMGLLIPLEIHHIEEPRNARPNVYGGKFWCPITGRLIYFHSRWERADIGDTRLKEDTVQDLWFGQTQKIENGFELEWKNFDDGDVLCLTIYPFYNNPPLAGWRNQSAATYMYKPSPLLKHIWFVKQGV